MYRYNDDYIFNVSETLTIYLSESDILFDSRFTCDVFTPNVTITVQAGDILGVCITDVRHDNDVRELSIIGENADGYDLMRTQMNMCEDGPDNSPVIILPTSVSLGSLVNERSRILHLYANITPSDDGNAA